MSFKRIPTDDTERIIVYALDGRRRPVTGLTDLLLSIWRKSGGTSEWLDFNDYTFKTSGWTTRQLALTERDATLSPGIYYVNFDTSSIVSPVADDTYYLEVDQYPGASIESQSDGVTSIPATRQFTSALANFISNSTLPGDMLTINDVSTPGDNDDYIIVSVDSETQVTVDKNWPTGSLTNLDYTVYTKTAKNMPQYGELGVGQSEDDIDDILSDTDEIQGKLPTNNIMGSSDKDNHDTQIEDIQSRIPATLNAGRMRSYVEVMDPDVVGSAQIATDAIDADAIATTAVNEIRDSILSDSTPFDGANIDVALSAILAKFDELPTHSLEMSFSYDPSTDTFSCNVWLEYANLVVINSGELQLDVYDQDRTLQFSLTASSPDAGGVFKVTQTPTGLVKNKGYYAEAEVTLPAGGGTVRGIKGMFTVG